MSSVLPEGKLPTGDSASTLLRRYSFVAPADDWIYQMLIGMLWDYSQESAWYKVGALTPAETAEIFTRIWETLGVDMATIGAIVPFGGGVLPSGWLVCDGSSLLRADYTALFAAIGTVWGAADGSHFNIPDLRGQTLLGQGAAVSGTTYPLGGAGGEETHTLTVGEIPAHTHPYSAPITIGTILLPPLDAAAVNPFPATTGSTGGGAAHENRQPYQVVNYAIIAS
jgi:microcystin-dependent protein